METNVKNLEEFGLSRNEANIYLFLLKKGQTTTGAIIKETGISNSRVYESLSSLINKGLVSYNLQKDGKHFQACEPTKLLSIEEERKQKIEKLLPDLLRIKPVNNEETTSAVYEGFEGFKTAFKKIIDDCPNNGTINIIGFSKQTYASESLRTFLKNMNLKSAQKRQKLMILMDLCSKKYYGKDRETEKYAEVKYMPDGYISPAAIDIFDDYVYMFLWEEKPFVYMIKNKTIAESFRHYFKFLWTIAKK